MVLDLTLMPLGADHNDWGFSHELLDLPRNPEVFDRIMKLPALPVPKKFSTFLSRGDDGEPCYGQTQDTPYGEPLLATTMAHLKTCDIPGPQGAFVMASPDEQRVALYWHLFCPTTWSAMRPPATARRVTTIRIRCSNWLACLYL